MRKEEAMIVDDWHWEDKYEKIGKRKDEEYHGKKEEDEKPKEPHIPHPS